MAIRSTELFLSLRFNNLSLRNEIYPNYRLKTDHNLVFLFVGHWNGYKSLQIFSFTNLVSVNNIIIWLYSNKKLLRKTVKNDHSSRDHSTFVRIESKLAYTKHEQTKQHNPHFLSCLSPKHWTILSIFRVRIHTFSVNKNLGSIGLCRHNLEDDTISGASGIMLV